MTCDCLYVRYGLSVYRECYTDIALDACLASERWINGLGVLNNFG